MDETEAAVAVATPARFERRSASQESVRERLDKSTEELRVMLERLLGTRPRATGMETKSLAKSVEMLEQIVRELKEGLGL